MIVGFENDVAHTHSPIGQRTVLAYAIDPDPSACRQLTGAVGHADQTRPHKSDAEELGKPRSADIVADQIESEEERGTLQAFDADKRVIGQERRHDAAREESQNGDIDCGSCEAEVTDNRESYAPRDQAKQGRRLRDRDRVRREQRIQRKREQHHAGRNRVYPLRDWSWHLGRGVVFQTGQSMLFSSSLPSEQEHRFAIDACQPTTCQAVDDRSLRGNLVWPGGEPASTTVLFMR